MMPLAMAQLSHSRQLSSTMRVWRSPTITRPRRPRVRTVFSDRKSPRTSSSASLVLHLTAENIASSRSRSKLSSKTATPSMSVWTVFESRLWPAFCLNKVYTAELCQFLPQPGLLSMVGREHADLVCEDVLRCQDLRDQSGHHLRLSGSDLDYLTFTTEPPTLSSRDGVFTKTACTDLFGQSSPLTTVCWLSLPVELIKPW